MSSLTKRRRQKALLHQVVRNRPKTADEVIFMNSKLMIGFWKGNWYGRRWIFQNVRTFCFNIFQNENVDILQGKKKLI